MAEKPINQGIPDDSIDEDSEGEQMSIEARNEGLLQACKENDVVMVKEFLNKQAVATYEKDGWNPLLWAACNGNEEIVRLLIKQSAQGPYVNSSSSGGGGGGDESTYMSQQQKMGGGPAAGDEGYDPFVKPEDPQKTGKYTPMHWASYKGHYKVVWLLLKANLQPSAIDMHGNTSVHQAAANAQMEVMKVFMMKGVDIKKQNARGHTPLDLCTDDETRALIMKAQKTRKCRGKNCNCSEFNFKNI